MEPWFVDPSIQSYSHCPNRSSRRAFQHPLRQTGCTVTAVDLGRRHARRTLVQGSLPDALKNVPAAPEWLL